VSVNGSVGHPVHKDWSSHESLLEHTKGGTTLIGKISRGTLVGKMHEWDSDVRIPINEMIVEVGESEERLNVFNFPRFRPTLDNLNFVRSHRKAFRRQDISKVFTGSDVKFTFVCMGEEIISTNMAENFHNVLLLFGQVVGICYNNRLKELLSILEKSSLLWLTT